MGKLLGVVATVVAMLALGSTTAAAATEFGSSCIANRAVESEPFSTIQLRQNGGQAAAPSSGVITKWKINLIPEVPFGVPTQLKVYRPTANESQFQVVGESASANVVSGANTFLTQIPIQAGDHLGLFGSSPIGTLFCAEEPEAENPGNVMGFFPGNPSPNSTATLLGAESELLVPAVAVIEPDADGDGFGDETQDACPQSAATRAPCPVVTLNVSATAKRKTVSVLVTGTVAANVTVNGKVNLGKGKKAKLKGGTKAVAPGAFTKFKLKFPATLTKRLEELSPKQSLTLKVTSTAPNLASTPTKKVLKVKLKGQGPKR